MADVADVDLVQGAARVRITGIRAASRALSKTADGSADMKELMHDIGMLVVRAARPPVLSGRLASTIRAGRGKTKAVVRAGGKRTPYAGPIHYGWPARGIAANRFLTVALRQQRAAVFSRLDRGITELLRKHDLT